MEITFLGTGTSMGVPVIACQCSVCQSSDPRDKRLRTAALIETNGKRIVIDIGPDFRQQMLKEGGREISGILLTHEHNDHVMGLDEVRAFNFFYKKDMHVYGQPRVLKNLKERFPYVFAENPYPGIPIVECIPIDKKTMFEIDGVSVIPIGVMHGRLPILGFRFNDLTYITDAKTIEADEFKKVKGTKILVLNALQKEAHHSHLTLEEALEMIEILKPERTYLLHISHRMGKHQEIQNILPPNVFLAYDGLKVNV